MGCADVELPVATEVRHRRGLEAGHDLVGGQRRLVATPADRGRQTLSRDAFLDVFDLPLRRVERSLPGEGCRDKSNVVPLRFSRLGREPARREKLQVWRLHEDESIREKLPGRQGERRERHVDEHVVGNEHQRVDLRRDALDHRVESKPARQGREAGRDPLIRNSQLVLSEDRPREVEHHLIQFRAIDRHRVVRQRLARHRECPDPIGGRVVVENGHVAGQLAMWPAPLEQARTRSLAAPQGHLELRDGLEALGQRGRHDRRPVRLVRAVAKLPVEFPSHEGIHLAKAREPCRPLAPAIEPGADPEHPRALQGGEGTQSRADEFVLLAP